MTLEEFVQLLIDNFPPEYEFVNPGGGSSKILIYSQTHSYYKRRNSKIRVSFESLYKAYLEFKGKRVTTSELKTYAPSVFDSSARPAGHSCNGTILFPLLRELGLASVIQGAGVRGNPFFVEIE